MANNLIKDFSYEGDWYDNLFKLNESSLKFFSYIFNKFFNEKNVYDITNFDELDILRIEAYENNNNINKNIILIIDNPLNLEIFIKKTNIIDTEYKLNKKIQKIKDLNDFENILLAVLNDPEKDKKIFIVPVKVIYIYFSYEYYKDYQERKYETPIKFIDVFNKKVIINNSNIVYCCWSYCWSIYNTLEDKEVFDIMCKYTKKIGFRYMWVDKYCINQDNDKYKEIPKMGEYYSNASGTVVWLHDVEDINDDMNKSEWLTRLWTLQEWELNNNRWIVTKNGKFIKYKENISKNLLPNSRLQLKLNSSHLHNLLIISKSLNCENRVDKIFGIIGMLKYSKYIKFSKNSINSYEDALNELLKVSDKFAEGSYLLSIKNNINDNYLFYVLELSLIFKIINRQKDSVEGLFTYKGIYIELKKIKILIKNKINKIRFIDNIEKYINTYIHIQDDRFKIKHKHVDNIISIIMEIIKDEKIVIYEIIDEYSENIIFLYDTIDNVIFEQTVLYMSNNIIERENLFISSLDTILKKHSNDFFSITGFSITKYNKYIKPIDRYNLYDIFYGYIKL